MSSRSGPAQPLLARAALWGWVARAFGYPEADLLATLVDPTCRAELDAAATKVDAALAAALAAVWEAADALRSAEPGLVEEHTYLFARHVRVPPYETSFRPSAGLGSVPGIAELGGFYAAFGLRPSAVRPERPDHLSVECEFIAALLAKEAYALAQGWAERAELTRQLRQRFVDEHLASWFPAFAERLERHRRLAFYPAVAKLLAALLALDLTLAGPLTISGSPAVGGPAS